MINMKKLKIDFSFWFFLVVNYYWFGIKTIGWMNKNFLIVFLFVMLEAFAFFNGTRQTLFGEVLVEYSAGHILNTIPKKLSVEHRSSTFCGLRCVRSVRTWNSQPQKMHESTDSCLEWRSPILATMDLASQP